MHHFAYRDGVLHAEQVISDALASAVGTPFYCYSTATLTRHYEVSRSFRRRACARLLCDEGQFQSGRGAHALPGLAPEPMLYRVVSSSARVHASIPADKIMFSGIGKTAAELALAVDEGILCVNIESEAELELLSSIAASKGRTANISVRVNPTSMRKRITRSRPERPKTSSASRSAARATSMPALRS